jgi:hypothetical protein
MSDDTEDTPEPSENENATGPLTIVQNNGERLRSILRMAFAACLAGLLVSTVALFSLYESLKSKTDSQEHRIERLNSMISDLLMTHENAQKIEKIEQQVNGIEGQLGDLTDTLKAQDAKAEAELEPAPTKKKKGR